MPKNVQQRKNSKKSDRHRKTAVLTESTMGYKNVQEECKQIQCLRTDAFLLNMSCQQEPVCTNEMHTNSVLTDSDIFIDVCTLSLV